MRGVHLLKWAGREFVRNLIWMLVVFGSVAAILTFGTGLPLLGVAAFVGIFVSVMAAIVTLLALSGGAHDEMLISGGNYPGVPPDGGDLGGWDGSGGGG